MEATPAFNLWAGRGSNFGPTLLLLGALPPDRATRTGPRSARRLPGMAPIVDEMEPSQWSIYDSRSLAFMLMRPPKEGTNEGTKR